MAAGSAIAHRGQAAGDEQPARLVHLPQRHHGQHVRARVHGGDRFRRGVRPGHRGDLLRGQRAGGGDGGLAQPPRGLGPGGPPGAGRPAWPGGRRPGREQIDGRRQRGGQDGGAREVAGRARGSSRGCGDQHRGRGVLPGRRDHLGLVHAQPDDEVGVGQQRPLHRAAGDQPARFGRGVRHDAARPVGVQRRDPAADHGGPDRGGVPHGVRAEQQDRPPGPGQGRGQRPKVTGRFRALIVRRARGAGGGRVVQLRDHRAGRGGEGQADRLRRGLAGPVPADRQHRLRHRTAQRRLVQPLVTDPAGLGGPDRVGDDHQGQPVQRRVRDPVNRAGQPRSPGDQHRARGSGQIGAGGRHDGGRGLGMGEDEAQSRRAGRPHHVQVRAAAGHAEHDPGARPGQRGHDRGGAGRAGGGRPGPAERGGADAHRALPPVPEWSTRPRICSR